MTSGWRPSYSAVFYSNDTSIASSIFIQSEGAGHSWSLLTVISSCRSLVLSFGISVLLESEMKDKIRK